MRAGLYIILVSVCLAVAWYELPFRLFWSFDRIEQHAKIVITGAELQAWALNMIGQYPTNSTPRVSQLGTNFPRQLLSLYHNPPYIQINEVTTNSPAFVFLAWGGGMIGHCGFEIGPTNFVSYRGDHKWQDGVYFWTDQSTK